MANVHIEHLPSTSSKPDEELLKDVVGGKVEDFAILMRRYNQRLFRVARSITRDEHEAEDVVQQAFISAYKSLAQFEGRAHVSTWLTRIAINEALSRVRRRKQYQEQEIGSIRNAMSMEDRPDAAVARKEMTRILEAAIDDLPTNARVVIVMRDIQEMSTNETAEVLGISKEAVRIRLHRARSSLREIIVARFDPADGELFAFAGARCDRCIRVVFEMIRQ